MSTVTQKLKVGAITFAAAVAVAGLTPVVAQADDDNTVPAPGPGNTAPANPSAGGAGAQPSVGNAAGQPSGRTSRGAAAAALPPTSALPNQTPVGVVDPSTVIANPPNGYGPAPTPAITDFQPLPTWLGRPGSRPCQIIIGPYGTSKRGDC